MTMNGRPAAKLRRPTARTLYDRKTMTMQVSKQLKQPQLFVQPACSTRSSALVTRTRPSTSSSLRITDRSFQYASPRLWNQLAASLQQPRTNHSNSDSYTCHLPLTHHYHHPSVRHCFTPGSKPSCSTNHFHPGLPSPLQTDSMVSCPAPFLLSISIFVF